VRLRCRSRGSRCRLRRLAIRGPGWEGDAKDWVLGLRHCFGVLERWAWWSGCLACGRVERGRRLARVWRVGWSHRRGHSVRVGLR